MSKISIVLSGPSYHEYSINYAIEQLKTIFPESEIIISTNDNRLASCIEKNEYIDKAVICENIGELPSLKFHDATLKPTNNNINKQIECCLKGIEAASNNLILRLRTDQLIFDNSILELWEMIEFIPKNTDKRGRIITSSIFSINPRYSERMPYHISDMLQLGYKDDLISYFSAPPYPFEYATWYERNAHHPQSNKFEKSFRSRFAVEQWLTLHYMFGDESKFPISYHNEWSDEIIRNFENDFIEYFIIAHPHDINLRASKFSSAESYYNTQCYSTNESLELLARKYIEAEALVNNYPPKGMNKKYFANLMPLIYSPITQFIIRFLSIEHKTKIKQVLNKLSSKNKRKKNIQ